MVLTITQKTFDDAVKENIEELGLSEEEAVTEAVEQFKAQGVDLSHIITELSGSSNFEVLSSALKKLNDANDSQILLEQLNILKKECDKGIQYKIQAGREGAYELILKLFLRENGIQERTACLTAMLALMTKQPDLLDAKGAEVIASNIDTDIPIELLRLNLRWAKECCLLHEMNRQSLFDLNIVTKLKTLLANGRTEVLKEILALFRAQILDDDVRVEFGRAHERAKAIATEALEQIVSLLKSLKSDEDLVNDLLLTLSCLLVRTEFCLVVEDAGGIDLIKELMLAYPGSEKVTRQSLRLIKALAGNDSCKAHIIQKGLAPVISSSLATNQGSVPAAAAGLNCVAALCLRSPENSKALFEAGIPEVIVEIMKKHPDEKLIQKPASWAIRNMVSRSRYQNSHFIDLGAEDLLKRSLGRFKDFEYDIKAALRDLECAVELKEEWTGKGGQLTSENKEE